MRKVVLGAVFALFAGTAMAAGDRDKTLDRSVEVLSNPAAVEDARAIGADAASKMKEARERWGDILNEFEVTREQAVKDGVAMFQEEANEMLRATGEDLEYAEERPLRYRVFVSQAMPREELRQLVELSRERQDLALVFRGMRPGQKIPELFEFILELMGGVKEGDLVPNVMVDPEPFRAIGTLSVPTLAKYDDDDQLIAFVSGVTSIDWLEEEIRRGKVGNIGQYGSVVEAVEEDMIEAMQRAARSMALDVDPERVVNGFFDRMRVDVPTAQEARVRKLDPSFVVEETIELPDGRILVEAGQVINPLAQVPFTTVLVAFNPEDPGQVAIAQEKVRQNPNRPVMLLATSLSGGAGAEGYGAMVDRIGSQIYFLTHEVRSRFDIQVVPTVVTAEGLQFRIEEIPPR